MSIMLYRPTMFENFSDGYYVGRFYVEAPQIESKTVKMNSHYFNKITDELYGSDTSNKPLVVKISNNHVFVYGDENVPAQTIAIPNDNDILSEYTSPPTLKEIFLAKGERAEQFIKMAKDPLQATPMG